MKSGNTLIDLPLWNMIVSLATPVVSIFINSIEIQVLRRTMNKQFYEKILLSLSVCDLINNICFFILSLAVSIVKDKFYILMIWSACGFIICYLHLIDMSHLLIISLDRVWAMGAPLHHRVHASGKKLVVLLVVAWCVPMIFLFYNIILVLIEEMSVENVFIHMKSTMHSDLSKCIVITNALLLLCYCVIIWIVYRKTSPVKRSKPGNRTKSMNTLFLCMTIVFVSILSTIPFVVVKIVAWNYPHWLLTFSVCLLPLNPIFNSVIYLGLRYRSKISVKVARRNTQESMVIEDTKL